ncbi:hypothetical protein AX15_003744 [Amanita polypyramis BW_CC]|nr:hypothetical protein AX15_003744 [Amanita polypyramis BW_CC]
MSTVTPAHGMHQLFESVTEIPDSEFDPATVKGNVSDDFKRLSAKIFAHLAGRNVEVFASSAGRQLRCTGIHVHGVENGNAVGRTWAESIYEVTVTREMCNSFAVMHGACASLLLELCTLSAIVVVGIALGKDFTGLTQSVNYIFHQPARLGRKLRVVATSMSVNGRIKSSRGEVWDDDTLCISCVHSVIHVGREVPREKKGKL